MTFLILDISLMVWCFTGFIVVLCAKEFLGAEVSLAKSIVAVIVGPIAIKRGAWVKEPQA